MEYMLASFPVKQYDVANFAEAYGAICCVGITSRTLELESEEVVLRTQNCCCTSAQRRPYAQLNVVEKREVCWGTCIGLNSDLAPMNEKGEGGIRPGCGCETEKVRQIVDDLNTRKDGRGKIAQMRQQRFMLEKVSKIAVQLPVLLKHYGVDYPPDGSTLTRIYGNSPPPQFKPLSEVAEIEQLPEFGLQEYDVSNYVEKLCCTNKLLSLSPDEASLTTTQSLTGSTVQTKVPYANIDSVDAMNTCGCCALLNAGELTQPPGTTEGGQPISPGCGCSSAIVEEIRADLQRRIDIRGNLGQIKQLEKMMSKYSHFVAELPLMLDKLGADTSYPPSQQTMTQIYGNGGPPVLATEVPHESASQSFDTKTYNVRNEIINLMCLLCTCGPTKSEIVLEPEQMVFTETTNCSKNVVRKPYAQLGVVDEAIICCCCTSVNGICPGYCCSHDLVREIAHELQARKVGRGNIAQLRNQENTMIKAIETDIRTDVLLHNQKLDFPPSQETMVSIYGPSPPTLPAANATLGKCIHYEPSQLLETKHYDITNTCARLLCCNLTVSLELNDEEAIFRQQSCCAASTGREPYAQLGSVEPASLFCGLCGNIQTDRNVVCPGCGCDHALLKELADELQHRKVTRGNIAQIKQQENLMMELIKLSVKVDLLSKEASIPFPPSQSTMNDVFGEGFSLPSIEIQQQPHRPSLTLVQVQVPAGMLPGSVFQANGPNGTFPATVPAGAVPGQLIQVPLPPRERNTEMQPLIRY